MKRAQGLTQAATGIHLEDRVPNDRVTEASDCVTPLMQSAQHTQIQRQKGKETCAGWGQREEEEENRE